MHVRALQGLPAIGPSDDLAGLIVDRADLRGGDVVVVASKVVAKSQGRLVDPADVTPSPEALDLAHTTGKDPRVVEIILRDSVGVSRAAPGVLIVRHTLGHVCANAGIDLSNSGAPGMIALLPDDPDGWASELRRRAARERSVDIAVIVSDSVGRPFRRGALGTAIGVAGLPALVDLRGRKDLGDRPLEHSESPLADVLAAAADLVMGQADEGTPVAIIRGVVFDDVGDSRAADLQRPEATDLYA